MTCPCLMCGHPFTPANRGGDPQIYCSTDCRKKWAKAKTAFIDAMERDFRKVVKGLVRGHKRAWCSDGGGRGLF